MLLLLIWPLVAHWDPPKGLNIDTKRLTPRGAHSGCNFSTWQLGEKIMGTLRMMIRDK